MRVLQIGSDRSKRGNLNPRSPAIERQIAYGERFGELDLVSFSLISDDAKGFDPSEHVHVHPTNSLFRILYGFDAWRIARRLPKPGVISVQDPFETGIIGWCIAKAMGIPMHVQVHTDFLSPEYARHSFLNRVRIYIAGFVLRRASGIRVVSGRIARSIEAMYGISGDKIRILPIYVDIETFKHATPDADIVERTRSFPTKLLIVSRLEPEKRVALAINAFAEAAAPSACLLIVGDGSERSSLEGLVLEKGIGQRVFFLANRSPVTVYPIADLVLVCSWYEGYGLVIIEALAAGKPVLSTDVGVAREMGAIIAGESFSNALRDWFENGPRTMSLTSYSYHSFAEYADAYVADIMRCIIKK